MKRIQYYVTLAITIMFLVACSDRVDLSDDSMKVQMKLVGKNVVPEKTIITDNKKIKLAVIPKGTTHKYWNSVKAGAEQACKDLGVEMVWKGPLKESDRAGQIVILQQFGTSDDIDGIVIAPLDENALLRPIQHALRMGKPVVLVDSPLNGKPGVDYVSHVATDNVKAGELGAKELLKYMGGPNKVVLMRYLEGSQSTLAREKGFLDVMHNTPGVDILVDNRYGGATSGEVKISALNLIDKIKEADGIYAPNEPSSIGVMLALEQVRLAGKKHFVGGDAALPLLRGLRKGEIDALIVQNPYKMGYEGVKLMVEFLHGKPVPAKINTEVAVVTKENIDSPKIQEFFK
ncbi:D-allose-binding periplasmic protein precursor [Poriferisphaera corsica]|uniref:D-allose-binding periplasmic protein n=1 Tax=Poriferisphaera corsica TaxID=2528020 RepID=A0A517YT20_9BACT|nr:substrate-binding domain-containing protein [Poriferisphaera corsica]QDU33379.1 D-allose-binding periplasmic protein precursor [Poriferisphaera corsica]